MNKAWEKVCDGLARANDTHDEAREDMKIMPGGYKEARQDYDDMMARQVRNSPPPLDDVGGDVSDMLDEKDPMLALLNDRGKTHGDYRVHAHITQSLKDVMRRMISWNRLSDCQQEALEMIAHKIGRILAGDPDHVDHWEDIAGYATLVSLDIISLQE